MERDNILIYNGENLPEDLKFCVTKAITNLFNSCRCIYDIKIVRSTHCIWFILSKNIPDYIVMSLLINAIHKAHNALFLQTILIQYPNILYNNLINNNVIELNYLQNISFVLAYTKSVLPIEYDILD